MASQFTRTIFILAVTALLVGLGPRTAYACACGCGVFDVGTASLFASGAGGTVYVEDNFMNQRQNWHGAADAPSTANPDRKIRTNFMTLGGQYMFNRSWGVMAQLPVWQRHYATVSSGVLNRFDHTALGDIRVMGVYSGFSGDMSTGIIFGSKLPTGDTAFKGFDADTQIGTGSTDLLLGLYHQGGLDEDANWIWYGQLMSDTPLLHRPGYEPGAEVDAALGAYYNSWYVGSESKLAPLFQVLASVRMSDHGNLADPANSGYRRLLLAPGLEFDTGRFRIYGDIELPIYQDVRGYQLIAPEQFKLVVSYAL
ncbi:MAG: hypothetical protein ACP5QR_07090 [Rhizomicrobium sp.]